MGVWVLAAAIVLAGAIVAGVVFLRVRREPSDQELEMQRVSEMRAESLEQNYANLAASQSELAGRLSQLAEAQTRSQAGMMKALEERLDAVKLYMGRSLTEQTDRTAQTLHQLQTRLSLIDDAQKNISSLSTNVTSLQQVLSGDKSRGLFGELQMQDLVKTSLPPSAYSFNQVLGNGRTADCRIELPNPPGPIVIDAKFPLETFHALRDAETDDDRRKAERGFRNAVLKHVVDIAERFIIAGDTAESALMFLPSEAVYAELHANFPDVVEKSFRARVWIVSPTTMMATLNTIRGVLKDAQMREQAQVIHKETGLMLDDVSRLQKRVLNLQAHFGQTERDVREILVAADKIARRAERIEEVQIGSVDTGAYTAPRTIEAGTSAEAAQAPAVQAPAAPQLTTPQAPVMRQIPSAPAAPKVEAPKVATAPGTTAKAASPLAGAAKANDEMASLIAKPAAPKPTGIKPVVPSPARPAASLNPLLAASAARQTPAANVSEAAKAPEAAKETAKAEAPKPISPFAAPVKPAGTVQDVTKVTAAKDAAPSAAAKPAETKTDAGRDPASVWAGLWLSAMTGNKTRSEPAKSEAVKPDAAKPAFPFAAKPFGTPEVKKDTSEAAKPKASELRVPNAFMPDPVKTASKETPAASTSASKQTTPVVPTAAAISFADIAEDLAEFGVPLAPLAFDDTEADKASKPAATTAPKTQGSIKPALDKAASEKPAAPKPATPQFGAWSQMGLDRAGDDARKPVTPVQPVTPSTAKPAATTAPGLAPLSGTAQPKATDTLAKAASPKPAPMASSLNPFLTPVMPKTPFTSAGTKSEAADKPATTGGRIELPRPRVPLPPVMPRSTPAQAGAQTSAQTTGADAPKDKPAAPAAFAPKPATTTPSTTASQSTTAAKPLGGHGHAIYFPAMSLAPKKPDVAKTEATDTKAAEPISKAPIQPQAPAAGVASKSLSPKPIASATPVKPIEAEKRGSGDSSLPDDIDFDIEFDDRPTIWPLV